MSQRVFQVGSTPAVRAALTAAFGCAPATGPVRDLAAGDVVCIEAFADHSARADVPGRNAFSACKAFKEVPGVAVHIVVDAADPIGVQLGRFVLADGVLRLGADGRLEGAELLRAKDHGRAGRSVDALLRRFGVAFASATMNSKALARLLEWERADSLCTQLQDAETGLFDGPYTALKLEEEFKRSQRFHLPLSLVLLDIGAAPATLPAGPDRRALLAEIAAVFLNECRDIDVLGRFTSTTFLFLLPGTPPDGAARLARRLLSTLRERRFPVPVEPVAGVAAVPDPGIADRKALLLVAEACLERARSGQGVGGLATSWE